MRGECPSLILSLLLIDFAEYHRRLYTLDSQIDHLQKASIRCLGAWLARRWDHCEAKRREAKAALKKSKQPLALLREEYKKQLAAQTKPLPSTFGILIIVGATLTGLAS